MRTHSQIIEDEGGATKVHRRLGLDSKEIHAVRSWKHRGVIPGERWKAFADAGIATLEELAEAAAAAKGVMHPDGSA